MTTADEFFAVDTYEQRIFDLLLVSLRRRYPSTETEVQKTDVALQEGGRPFAYVWVPGVRRIPGRPLHYVIVSFGLNRCIDDPRMTEVTQSYPGRWMHHVVVAEPADIDDTLIGWLTAARNWKIR